MKRFTAIILLSALLLTACTGDKLTESSDMQSSSTSSANSENSSADSDSTASGGSSAISGGSSTTTNSSSSESSSDPTEGLTPLSFTDEDLELQEILRGLISGGAYEAYGWFYSFTVREPVEQKIRFNGDSRYDDRNAYKYDSYHIIPENYKDYTLTFPSTRDEMEKIVGRFFTKQETAEFMKRVAKGTVTGEEDGVLLVTLDSDTEVYMPPYYLEAGGRMYHINAFGVHQLNLDYNTARVTAKSDGKIEFTFLKDDYAYEPNTEFRYEELYYDYAEEGYIVLEDGEWKLPHIYV
ncbi:MAG: hypothetical protein J1F28_03090 [Oscillospiraceae bacterium]|nr:hypothetical protein [Oscillospiraceae bacterium]